MQKQPKNVLEKKMQKTVKDKVNQKVKVVELTAKQKRKIINEWTRKKNLELKKAEKEHKRLIKKQKKKEAKRIKLNERAISLWNEKKREEAKLDEKKMLKEAKKKKQEEEKQKILEASRNLYKKWLMIKTDADLQKIIEGRVKENEKPKPNSFISNHSNKEDKEEIIEIKKPKSKKVIRPKRNVTVTLS